MRVLHVSSDYTMGGAGRHLLTLVRHAAYSRVEATVACPEGGPLWERLRAAGVTVQGFPQKDRSLDPGLVLRLAKLTGRGRFDIVHTHASLSARLAARLTGGARIVVTRHTLPPAAGVAVARPTARRSLAGAVQALLADRFIAVSDAVRREMISEGIPADMIETIHNGVDPAEIEDEAAREDGRSTIAEMAAAAGAEFAPGAPIVGTLGRLSPEKGHEILVRAAPHILSAIPQALIVIVGHGAERERLESVARELGVARRVLFAGYRENAASLVRAFTVFAMPSLGEALGIALLEAMVLERPVVASATGGIPEIVRDGANGLLVPPGDPAVLASAIERLLRDEALSSRLAAAGRRSVLTDFSAAAMAKKTVALYERVIGERARIGR